MYIDFTSLLGAGFPDNGESTKLRYLSPLQAANGGLAHQPTSKATTPRSFLQSSLKGPKIRLQKGSWLLSIRGICKRHLFLPSVQGAMVNSSDGLRKWSVQYPLFAIYIPSYVASNCTQNFLSSFFKPTNIRKIPFRRRNFYLSMRRISNKATLPKYPLIHPSCLVEEETVSGYVAERYYPARLGELLNDRYKIVGKLVSHAKTQEMLPKLMLLLPLGIWSCIHSVVMPRS